MFFWNVLAFYMIQWMLAVWSLVLLPFLNPTRTSGSFRFTYCWSLAWRILSITLLQFSSVQSLSQPHRLQHAWLPCPSPTLRAYSNSCPSLWWCHPTISSPVIPISSCLKSFPASGSFQMSQFWESHFLGRLIRSLGVPKERGVWNSQGGRKDKLFSFSTFLKII